MNAEQFKPDDVCFYIRPVKKKCRGRHEDEVAEENVLFQRLECVADDFTTVMESLLEYARQVLEVAHNSIANNLHGYHQGLLSVIKEAPGKKRTDYEMVVGFKSTEEQQGTCDFVVPILDLDKALKINEYLSTAIAAPRILCSTILQQIVNTWECLLSNFFSVQMSLQRKLINGKLSIPYESIRNIRDVSEVHRLAIEQTVYEIMRQGTRDQIAALKTYFGIDALSSLKDIKVLEEIVVRRHTLVHCGGIASGDYCRYVSRLGLKEPKIGADVSPTVDYIFSAWDEMFSTGAIVSHLISCQNLKSCSGKESERLYGGQADKALLARSYMALEKRRYKVVQRIGEYVKQRRLHNEWTQKALFVNLALAYKYQKKDGDFASVLNELDEHSCPSDFAAPIACLHGDFDKAFRIVKRGCKQRDCRKSREAIRQLIKWPVYAELRKTNKCSEFLQTDQIRALVTECEKEEPRIDFVSSEPKHDDSLMELFDLCQEKGRRNE